MNQYISAMNRNRFAGNKVKQEETEKCAKHTKIAMRNGVKFSFPCKLKFVWYIPNKKKDPDNIASARKFILDGMQKAGFMDNDNLNWILGFEDEFVISKDEISRVEITEY